MDSKIIVLLVFILFAIVISFMVGNGMTDLVSIYQRVTKNQAEEGLGGVKLQIVSPVPSVYYQAQSSIDGTNPGIDLGSILKITGQNLDGKTLTISVASPHWMLEEVSQSSNNGSTTYTVTDSGKTLQFQITTDSNGNYVLNGIDNTNTFLDLVRVDTTTAPYQMPEFVELIFAVGETAKADVTIVVEPSA